VLASSLKASKEIRSTPSKFFAAGVDLEVERAAGTVEQESTVEFSRVGDPVDLFP